jgi:hypothetical protein
MLQQISFTPTPVPMPPTQITRDCVIQMVQNFIDGTGKLNAANTFQKISPNLDSHCVHFLKREIDELFLRNGYDPARADAHTYGLRIFFGLHKETMIELMNMPGRPLHYIGQHTAVLVCTRFNDDLLNIGNVVGNALDEGQICPPPLPCSSIANELHS